ELPREVTAKDRFRLLADGKPVEAQFRSLEKVGEKKSVALDFNLSVGPLEKKTFTVEYGPNVTAGPGPKGGGEREQADGVYTVRSAGMTYVVDPAHRWLRSVRDGKTEYLRPGKETAPRAGGGHSEISAVRQGPLAVCLRLRGKPGWVPEQVDLTFPRSKS